MADPEKIMTLHPQGKQGTRIDLKKYDQIKSAILATLEELKEATLDDLVKSAEEILRGQFDGKVIWYVVTVKLDLEARKIIERIPKTSPHRVRLT
ncbi:MAG: hypothetical protein RIC80_08145 [Cyclobacteriaceae bacterium]